MDTISPTTPCYFAWLGWNRAMIGWAYVIQDNGHNSWNHRNSCDCCNFVVPDFSVEYTAYCLPGYMRRYLENNTEEIHTVLPRCRYLEIFIFSIKIPIVLQARGNTLLDGKVRSRLAFLLLILEQRNFSLHSVH